MSIVWVLEDPKQGRAELARELIGSFAIRCVASMNSLKWLIKMEKNSAPKVIVANLDHFDSERLYILDELVCLETDAIVIAAEKGASSVERLGEQHFLYTHSLPSDPIVQFIKDCVQDDRADTASFLNYRDIDLNMSEFSFRVQPHCDFVTLSNLEFKLLRLFVNNPNKCFKRDELIELVWDKMKVASRTVDSQISRLRKRLDESECKIESVYGGGYKLI